MKQLTRDSIRRYADERIPPGGFLVAVLSNDLKGAIGRADEENLRDIVAIVRYCVWDIPSECWGSPEAVDAWLRADPRYVDHDDDRARLVAWYGELPMGGWTDGDEEAFRAAVEDELRKADDNPGDPVDFRRIYIEPSEAWEEAQREAAEDRAFHEARDEGGL